MMRHGIDCVKAPHTRDGYLHAEDDDTPYNVDGLLYCGRCHTSIDSESRLCQRDPCRIPDCDCQPVARAVGGRWLIERKMHDGYFTTYAEGYPTIEKAKNAASRAGKSTRHTSTWRVVHEDGTETFEATFRPQGRAKWTRAA